MFICVLDFEATCFEDSDPSPRNEVIEFPSVLYDENFNKISEFHEYVMPMNYSISKFCTQLTGITEDMVQDADTFMDVLQRHTDWLRLHTNDRSLENVVFLTCGAWDMDKMFKAMVGMCKIKEFPICYTKYINIKKDFAKKYNLRRPIGMAGMLKHAKLELVGRHHSGIDDTRNIAKIFEKMIRDGYDFTNSVNIVPYKNFLKQLGNGGVRIS